MVIRDGIVTTRKPHKCYGCLKEIPKGTPTYMQVAKTDDGSLGNSYFCNVCKDYCQNKECRECFEFELANPGFIKECIESH